MDRNTNEDSKTSDGDGGAAAGGSGDHRGGRSEDGNGTDRPRRRRSGDALRLQEVLLTRRDELLGGSSASLDALDTSPRGDQQRRRRVRSRQASEDLLTMAASHAALGRGGERDQQDADGQQAGDSTAAVGLGQQRQGGEVEQSGRSGELPPPRLASMFSDRGGGGAGRQEPLDRDRMAEILSAALAISAGEFGYDEGQVEGMPERTRRNYFDDDKRPPQ